MYIAVLALWRSSCQTQATHFRLLEAKNTVIGLINAEDTVRTYSLQHERKFTSADRLSARVTLPMGWHVGRRRYTGRRKNMHQRPIHTDERQ